MSHQHGSSSSAIRRRVRWRRLELGCWLLAVVLAAPQLGAVAARHTLSSSGPGDHWSEARRDAYRALLERGGLPAPVAQLELPEQSVRVPVFSGTGEPALTLGAGHLPETAALSGQGNIALAGHRDGYFRDLRHLAVGDELVLHSPGSGARTFRVVETLVVAPEDVWVLDPTERTMLTLITCHPFYFVGHAPDRYIVRAQLEAAAPVATAVGASVSAK